MQLTLTSHVNACKAPPLIFCLCLALQPVINMHHFFLLVQIEQPRNYVEMVSNVVCTHLWFYMHSDTIYKYLLYKIII